MSQNSGLDSVCGCSSVSEMCVYAGTAAAVATVTTRSLLQNPPFHSSGL